MSILKISVIDNADRCEQELKQAFINYARDDSSNKIVKLTIEGLGTEIKNGFTVLESTANVYGDKFFEYHYYTNSRTNKLPAILFQYDRKGCVELALHILEKLAENKKRADDPECQAKKKEAISQEKAQLKRTRDL